MKGADQCPRCGSDSVAHITLVDSSHIAGCTKCQTLWEPFSPSDLSSPNNPNSIFKKPCENCAFRPGSPEREDPVKWQALWEELILTQGSAFFCHKGVPLSTEEGQSHEHPKCPDGTYDTKNMRHCAGWLASKLGYIYKDFKRSKGEAVDG